MEEFVKNAQHFWSTVNVEEYQPVAHGPEPTKEETASREALAIEIVKKIREYNEYKENVQIKPIDREQQDSEESPLIKP